MLRSLRRPKTTTNPLFYSERVRSLLGHDEDRLQRALEDPRSLDLLTWNVFESMDTDPDRAYLASLLEPLAGSDLRAPVRIILWTGRHREPLLRPSPEYVRHIRARVDGAADLDAFTAPIEAPVRIETPELVVLVDTMLDAVPPGAGGRDRVIELVDAGLTHARYVGKTLVVAYVYRSGSDGAARVSARLNSLRDPDRLAAALPWRERVPEVRFREVSWQQLLRTWERERGHFMLSGQPVRDFLQHAERLGLR